MFRQVRKLVPTQKSILSFRVVSVRFVSRDYQRAIEFEPVNMRYFFDGELAEFKDEIRKTMIQNKTLFCPPMSSSEVATSQLNKTSNHRHQHVIEQMRVLMKAGHVSVAHASTQPMKFLALYEVAATVSGTLALALATHFHAFANLCAVEGQAYHHRSVLGEVDSGELIGTSLSKEVIADEPPYGTSAAFDSDADSFYITSDEETLGSSKIGAVNGSSAKWAVVTADLMTNLTNHGPHMFLLQLRNAAGKTIEGVKIRPMGPCGAADGLGAAIIRLDKVRVPREALLTLATTIDAQGKVTPVESYNGTPMLPLITNQRLAACSIALGKAKAMMCDIVCFLASKKIPGPDGERDYPVFGLQMLQNRTTQLLADTAVLVAAYHTVAKLFTDSDIRPDDKHFVHLAALVTGLVEHMVAVANLGLEVSGAQGTLNCVGFTEAISLAGYLREGPYSRALAHLVAREAIAMGYVTQTETNIFRSQISFGRMHRWLFNLGFTPGTMLTGKMLTMVSDIELRARKQLQRRMSAAVRTGPVEAFFVVHTEYFRTVETFAQAFIDAFLIDNMITALDNIREHENHNILGGLMRLSFLCRLCHQFKFVAEEKLLPMHHLARAQLWIDGVGGLALSHQAVHLVDAFAIPKALRPSPLAADYEKYWEV